MNYTQLLQQAFKPLDLVPDKHAEFFSFWEEIDCAKGEKLTEIGQIERYFYVVVSGVQCLYLIARNGEKKVIGFSFDGSFSGIYDSYLAEKSSHYHLEALTASRLLRMPKRHYDQLFDLYPEFNFWGRIVHQQLLVGRVQREIELITLNSKERFDVFMERCPKPLLTIPQKYLAAYLNMTPETFSRLRALKS